MAEPNWLSLAESNLPYWQTNRAALDKNQPGLADRLQTNRQRTDIQIHLNEANVFRCRNGSANEAFCPEADDQIATEINTVCQPIAHSFHEGKWLCLVMGCGAGWFLAPIIEYLERNHRGEPKGILVLEQDPGLLLAVLGCFDFSAHIESGRVLFASGPELARDCQSLWDAHHLETLDEKQISAFCGYDLQTSERKKTYQDILQTVFTHHNHSRQAYFELLRACEARWSNPNQPIERVWTHITDDRGAGAVLLGAIEGFQTIGLQAQGLRLSDRLFTRFHRSAFDFYQHAPDLMVCANHSSNYVSWFAEQAPVPRLVWYVDHPKNTVEFDYHPQDRLVLIAENFRDEAERRGGKVIGVLPVGAPVVITAPTPSRQWRHDVSYVGSVIDNNKVLSALPEEVLNWINQVVDEQLADPLRDLQEIAAGRPVNSAYEKLVIAILQEHEPKARFMNDRQLLEYFLYGEANTRRRLNYIKALKNISSLGVYGPSAWNKILPDEMKQTYLGKIETSEDLHQLYRDSKINLSINALQGFGFLNPRVFETPAAGGFLLAEWTPGLDKIYLRDEEMGWFHNESELLGQIETFISNDVKRFQIVEHAQERIKKEHTYTHRAQAIVNMLKNKEQ